MIDLALFARYRCRIEPCIRGRARVVGSSTTVGPLRASALNGGKLT